MNEEVIRKALEDALDWNNEAPIPELDAVELAIEWQFPANNIITALKEMTGKTERQIMQDSFDRIK